MHRPGKGRQPSIMGFRMTGDVFDFTTWRAKSGRQSYMVKAPPKRDPSPAQVVCRSLFRAAMNGWKSLSPQAQKNYQDAANILKFQLLGHNLYITCYMRDDWRDTDNAARLTGLDLPHP